MTNNNWNIFFYLVIITVSQVNTKLFALKLIGKRDFFPQSMPVPNVSNKKQRRQRKTNTGKTQHPWPNQYSNPGPLALQSGTYPLHQGGQLNKVSKAIRTWDVSQRRPSPLSSMLASSSGMLTNSSVSPD